MTDFLPVNRAKRKARVFYDRISGVYDWMTASESNYIKRGIQLLSISPGEKLLEIGSGTGTGLALIIDASAMQGTSVGVDLSHQMLVKSQQKTAGKAPSPILIQADAAHLPIQTNRFDGALCVFTLELFSAQDITKVLYELKRTLKPGARLVIVSLSLHPRNLSVMIYELIHRLFPVAVDCRPIPLNSLLEDHGVIIETTEKAMNWGLPVQITRGTFS